jgi:hypothetical protein
MPYILKNQENTDQQLSKIVANGRDAEYGKVHE